MLNEKQIQDILRIRLNQPVNPLNYKILGLTGTADGSELTRLYTDADIQSRYVRIIQAKFAFYTDNTNWIRESAYDNKTFTSSSNDRFSTLGVLTRIPPEFFEKYISTNKITLKIDNLNTNIFPQSYCPMHETYDLNIMTPAEIQNGIDMTVNATFYNDMSLSISTPGSSITNPIVSIELLCEMIQDIQPYKFEKVIK